MPPSKTGASVAEAIGEAVEKFAADLAAHPGCRADLRDEAMLAGRPRRHAVFRLGRRPDFRQGEKTGGPAPPHPDPERRLLDWLRGAAGPLGLLNPIAPERRPGLGPGTLAASFGIFLNPDAGFTPQGSRPIDDVLAEGMPSPESSGLLPQVREDIEATKALTPTWVKIVPPDMQGPFNIAHMVLGDNAFTAPICEPDKWEAFMKMVTDFFISVHDNIAKWIGSERTNPHPGSLHRIAECSVNMTPPEFYVEHVLRFDRRVAEHFGEVAIHPCSGPHVFHATLENLPNVVHIEAGTMLNKMTAGSIGVEEAIEAIGDRPILLQVGEELADGAEEETIRRIFDLTARNPRVRHGFTGLGWKKGDEPRMIDLHRRMNEYYAQLVG